MPPDPHETIRVPVEPGVALHAVVAGPPGGPVVVLLHGFPEFWYGWRKQIGPLAQAGFRVIVPDQRGYGLSDKPAGVEAYRLDRLAADVVAIADRFGAETIDLVGHDWGGVVAWWVAARHPLRVRRLVVVNAPHPVAAIRYARKHRTQLRRSWYVAFFQLPAVPEWLLARGGYRLLQRALTASAPPDLFGPAELAAYRAAWSSPGALTGMVNWYRSIRGFRAKDARARIRSPALILWGARDPFLEAGLAEASAALCDRATVLRYDDAGHWVQHERPGPVNAAILQFLDGGRRSSGEAAHGGG
ncbi:alpha/beta fold hydrolase [Faunimonas sp. B44]|uniref:alpha/beta fold hydrolase n=1 Tax=Faunimonas sp. B44 TaxID=3461493 RepID=UPI0040447EAA